MKVRVHYPLTSGRMVLRTEDDWDKDVLPTDETENTFDFVLERERSFRYFKPVVVDGDDTRWAQGPNALAVRRRATTHVFPYFDEQLKCHVCDLQLVPSSFEERGYEVRVFLPPGYDENVLERFPVLYMQDGQNLFFADGAFAGKHWRISETLSLLDKMNLVQKVIVVGVYPRDRMQEYTSPGYVAYTSFLADELKPWVDEHYRTLSDPGNTAVLGSSLGGVVSLFAGWERPDVFGRVGCMSSTFGYEDDLVERISSESKRPIRVYLDSGWPSDNYEVTRGMRAALRERGYREGKDLAYFAFPEARHDEDSWAARVHVPFQFWFGN